MKPKTHLVEQIDREVEYTMIPEAIEQGYERLAERAESGGYLIVAVVQSAHIYKATDGERLLVLITAQVVNREAFENQQRRASLLGRPVAGMN